MKVMYVNHTSRMSGAEHSLLDLLSGLPTRVSPLLACPDGELAVAARRMGVPVEVISGTDLSFRLHPVHTVRGLAHVLRDATKLVRVARRHSVTLVHANSVRAGFIASPLSVLGRYPLIVHVRDCLPDSTASRLTRRAIATSADVVVSNSRYTTENFSRDCPTVTSRTIHNAVALSRFSPALLPQADTRSSLGLAPDDQVVGVVGNLAPWKGQDDAIRAIARVATSHPKVKLVVVGEPRFVGKATRYDNQAYADGLRRLVAEHGLERSVLFLGHRDDVPTVLSALDVLLVPSHEEPFGRTVIEGMAMGLPVIATSVGGPSEIISDAVDGLLRPPRRPDEWARTISALLADPSLRMRLGSAARSTVELRFSLQNHVEGIVATYQYLLGGTGSGAYAAPSEPAFPSRLPLVVDPAGSGEAP